MLAKVLYFLAFLELSDLTNAATHAGRRFRKEQTYRDPRCQKIPRVGLSRLFQRLLKEERPETFEIEAAKAIAGLSAAIYQTHGPERLDAILEAVPEAVGRDVAKLASQNWRGSTLSAPLSFANGTSTHFS
jgi:hypothetical protein